MNPRNRVFVLLGIIFLAAAIYYWLTANHTSDLVLVGTVDANQVVVSPRIGGKIAKLLVDEGTPVQPGDLIAEIDASDIAAQKAAAAATSSALKNQVAQTQATAAVTRGETTSGVANANARLQSARAQLATAQADLKRFESDDQRIQRLAREGVASQQQADQSRETVAAQQARVAALQDEIRAAQADVATAQARLHQQHAAQSTVASTQAQEQSAQAQLKEIETRLGWSRVTAPVAGTVSVRVAREGEVVQPGAPIVTIVDLSDTWIRAAVPETDAVNIKLGDKLKVQLPSGKIMEGTVTFKGVEAEFATQRDVSRRKRDIKTVVLKVKVDNSDKSLAVGMTANVLIPQSKAGE
jgi:HlyD family secretion protein